MRHVTTALLAMVLLAGAVGCAPAFVMRVNCGSDKEYTDDTGVKWAADQVLAADAKWGAKGGLTIERVGMTIPLCLREKLYVTERYSMDAYEFSVENGTYTVRLHFAETYERHTQAGVRLFSVKINGEMKLKDLDVFKEAGGFAKPLIMECSDIAVTDGKLKIEFVANVQNPEINAIEVVRY
ncbi:MAG: malectin [Phycisphaerae bacterium]